MVVTSRRPSPGRDAQGGEVLEGSPLINASPKSGSLGMNAGVPLVGSGGRSRSSREHSRPRMRLTKEMLVVAGIRGFTGIAILNCAAVLALLFSRVFLHPRCAPRVKVHGPEGTGAYRLEERFLHQRARVTQRMLMRRKVTLGRRLHPVNDALLPTFACPQKLRVGGIHPDDYFWLCMPNHLTKLHWPVAYSLGKPRGLAYEADLFTRFGLQSKMFDTSMSPGINLTSSHFFVTNVGGPQAEPTLAELLTTSSNSLSASGLSSPKFYAGVPFLKVNCYACASSFLTPVFSQPSLATSSAIPPAGQIVVRFDRWGPPFDATSREVIGVLEGSGYHMFHAEQIWNSYRNQSYSVSFIHQSLLFPGLLRKNFTWDILPKQRQASA